MLQSIVLLWICNHLAAPQWCIVVSWIGIIISIISFSVNLIKLGKELN